MITKGEYADLAPAMRLAGSRAADLIQSVHPDGPIALAMLETTIVEVLRRTSYGLEALEAVAAGVRRQMQ